MKKLLNFMKLNWLLVRFTKVALQIAAIEIKVKIQESYQDFFSRQTSS